MAYTQSSSSAFSFHAAKSTWQHEVSQSDLPFNTKGFLLFLSVEWMDAQGGSCFPSEQQIMEKAGISRPALTGHIRRAVDGGFLEVTRYGRGLKNRRYNYRARLLGDPAQVQALEDGKDSYASLPGDGKDSYASLTILNLGNQPESAEPEPTAEPVAVALSSEALRAVKTLVPDGVPASWIEAGQVLRPDLPVEVIRSSAEVFLDHHRAKGTVLTDWLPAWRNWLRRERAPKGPQTAHKPLASPTGLSPYSNWPTGPAPICRPMESPEQAAARFAEAMQRYGAVPGEGGVYTRPITVQTPATGTGTPATAVRPQRSQKLTPDAVRRIAAIAAAGGSLREVGTQTREG